MNELHGGAGTLIPRAYDWNSTNFEPLMKPYLHLARSLRTHSTAAEKRLWERLRARRLDGLKFKRQVPIGEYIADFVWSDAKLIVDLDGGHHAEQAQADAERTRNLEAAGFLVLRFWNNDIMARVEHVLAEITGTAKHARRKPEWVSAVGYTLALAGPPLWGEGAGRRERG